MSAFSGVSQCVVRISSPAGSLALAEHFGARVASSEVERAGKSQDSRREARAFVECVLDQRLQRRGRRRSEVVR